MKFISFVKMCLFIGVVSLTSISCGNQVKLDVAIGNQALLSNKKSVTYLKVGLTGFEIGKQADRVPVNIALVIDKSGSMGGNKMAKAKDAAIMAVNLLNKNDIISIITYDNGVEVLVPATKLTDKEQVIKMIRSIDASGGTALFAGVSKGASEISKFFDKERVNRVILLSDGQANVGPSSPGELGALGEALGKKGISVTTIGLGLGYNDYLMTELASKSDGNHAFVQNESDLVKIFNLEFKDVLSVVAQEVVVKINCAPGVRPIRVLGRDAEINGQNVILTLNQIYSKQEKYMLLEVEISPSEVLGAKEVANVSLSYFNLESKVTDRLTSAVSVRFTTSKEALAKGVEKDVMIDAIAQIATINSKLAIVLRDKGEVAKAKAVLQRNTILLEKNIQKFKSSKLMKQNDFNIKDINSISDKKKWDATRRRMHKNNYSTQNQQSY